MINIEMFPAHPAAGPVFCPVAKGAFSYARQHLQPTHFLGLVDSGERSPLHALHWSCLLGRSMILQAEDDDRITIASVLSILRFGERLKRRSRVLVHCHHGRSRSTAAVALLVAQAHGRQAGQELLDQWSTSTFRQPNRRMIQLGSILLGMPLHTWDMSDSIRPCSSMAERVLGKDEAARSIRAQGTTVACVSSSTG